jgi:uncharacterized protein involved in exopolysaccharide biosynthesis
MTVAPTGAEPGDKPSGYFVLMPPAQDGSAHFDARSLGRKLLLSYRLILGTALVFAVLAAIHAYLIATPIYRSTIVVSVRTDTPNNAPTGGLSGLASLAGINLHGGGPGRIEYVAKLRSRELVEMLIHQDNLLPVIFASKYDAAAKRWKNPGNVPSMDDAVAAFKKIYSIGEDPDTGLITVQVGWKDRFVAAQWARDIIGLANSILRASAYKEAQRNISYLTGQTKVVEVESLRQSIVNLMETNLNQAMLANAQPDYAFKVMDPPTVSDADKFVSPVRKIEILSGFLAGMLLAAIFVLWRGNAA